MESNLRIVLIEDNAMLARGVVQALGDIGHGVDWLSSGTEGDEFLARHGAELAIIDVNLPGQNGLEIVRAMRARGDRTPVLMLTARSDVADRVRGLDAGADDYVVKPFEMAELFARIRALDRRRASAAGASKEQIGALVYDRTACTVTGPKGELALPRRELALFDALFDQAGRVVSKENLCARLYGTGADIDMNAVELLVSRLRPKLSGSGVEIRTIRGLGYLMQARVTP